MSYYNKHERTMLLSSINEEKKVLQALLVADLATRSSAKDMYPNGLRSGKKHSSATLLRRKLNSQIIRELNDI